jgi:hypothetical protein
MKKLIYILLVLLIGCKSQEQNEVAVTRYLDDNSEPLDYKTVIEEIDFIQLDSSDGFLLSTVNQMINHNNKWFVLDNERRNALLVFDNDGNPIEVYDRQGRGPGEYIEIAGFDVSPDSGDILLLCGPPKIIILDKYLELKHEIEVKKFYERGMFYDEGVLLYSYYGHCVDYLSFANGKVKTLFEYGMDKDNAFTPTTPIFHRDNGDVYFHTVEVDKLYKVENLEFREVATIDYANKEEAKEIYTTKGYVSMGMEEVFKYSRPRILCVMNRNDRLSFIYNKMITFINIDMGNDVFVNRNIGALHGSTYLIKVDNSLVGWISPLAYDKDTFNQFGYYDGIKINYLDASKDAIMDNGNPILVIYKLKADAQI